MGITEARATYDQAVAAASEAARAKHGAHRALYAELRAAFDERLAAEPGDSVSSGRLAELGFPCQDCLCVVQPFDGRHEIHIADGRMTATCGWLP